MVVGIDASNIRTGGGRKHLMKFIDYSIEINPNVLFILVSNRTINNMFKSNHRVKCITNTFLNSHNLFAFISQFFCSYKYFRNNNCDVVFVPGGIFLSKFKPFYTMSQNMLPFDLNELTGFSHFKKLKFKIIRILQLLTFKKSNGVIYLTEYAKNTIHNYLTDPKKATVIPHGITQQKYNHYNLPHKAFNILYVSDFLPYKHNYNVAKAVSELIYDGVDINLTLIGKKDKKEFNKINNIISKSNSLNNKIKIFDSLNYSEVIKHYKDCSLFLFASTCENLPFIILEAMSYGLPIISTNKKPMTSIINGKDIFFDSHDINSIKDIILKNMSKEKLLQLSKDNFNSSKNYTWKNNVFKTLELLSNAS